MTMRTDFSAGEPMHDHDHNARQLGADTDQKPTAQQPAASADTDQQPTAQQPAASADTDQQPTIQQPAAQVPPAGGAAPPAANGHQPLPGHPPAGQPPMATWGGEAAPAWG